MSNTRKRLAQRSIAGISAGLMIASGAALAAAPAYANSDFTFTRIAGPDRFATAADTAANTFKNGSDVAILANGLDAHIADALAGNYLAGAVNAPILLTEQNTTPKATTDELDALNVKTIWVLGNSDAISDAQVTALEGMGYTVKRLGGATRYDTMKDIVEQPGATNVKSYNNAGPTAIIADGQNAHLADALSAGAVAFHSQFPVITTWPDHLADQAKSALQDLGIKQVIILGDDNSISPAVVQQIKDLGISVITQVAGSNRSQTSTEFADWLVKNLSYSATHMNLASGAQNHLVDALAAGPHAGSENTPIVETYGVNDAGYADDYATEHANTLQDGHIFGDSNAVSDAVQTAVTKAGQTTTTNQSYNVTPSTAQTVAQGKSVQYAVSGLDNGTTYTVDLFNCDNVQNNNGTVSFTQTTPPSSSNNNTGSGVADEGDRGANGLSVVNGVATASSAANYPKSVSVQPSNGTITFTVNNNDTSAPQSCVVPVVYQDANNSGTLNVDKSNGQPSEHFGTGGAATFTPPAATSSASYVIKQVLSVDKAAGTFVATTTAPNPGGTYTFNYTAAGDSYNYVSPGAGAAGLSLTQSQFADYLSGLMAKAGPNNTPVSGDALTANYNASGPSSFSYTTDVPAAPTDTTANYEPAVTTGSSAGQHAADRVKVTWTAPSNPDVSQYNVYRADVAKDGSVGTFTQVGTVDPTAKPVSAASTSGGTTYYDTNAGATAIQPGHTYAYEVTAVGDGQEGPVSNQAQATYPAASSPGAVAGAPYLTDARAYDAPGAGSFTVSPGDQIELTFNEPMAASAAQGSFRVSDGVHSATITCDGVEAACKLLPKGTYNGNTVANNNMVLAISLLTAPTNPSPTGSAVSYPASITQVTNGVQDADEGLTLDLSKGDTSIDSSATSPFAAFTQPVITPQAAAPAAGDTAVTFTSDKALDPATVGAGDFSWTGAGANSVKSASVSADGKTITVTLNSALATGDTVKMAANSVSDPYGNTGPATAVSTLPTA